MGFNDERNEIEFKNISQDQKIKRNLISKHCELNSKKLINNRYYAPIFKFIGKKRFFLRRI